MLVATIVTLTQHFLVCALSSYQYINDSMRQDIRLSHSLHIFVCAKRHWNRCSFKLLRINIRNAVIFLVILLQSLLCNVPGTFFSFVYFSKLDKTIDNKNCVGTTFSTAQKYTARESNVCNAKSMHRLALILCMRIPAALCNPIFMTAPFAFTFRLAFFSLLFFCAVFCFVLSEYTVYAGNWAVKRK